jgi:hypothetical protein
MVMARDEETFPKVFARVKELYKQGRVIPTYHKKLREAERQIWTIDVDHLIQEGRMVSCKHDLMYPTPSYTIEGLSIDGDKIAVCVAITEDERLLIVTVMRVK